MRPTNHRQDQEAAVRWAAEMQARRDVLYLDTETTGIDDDAEIIDIAVIDGSGRVLLDSLVRPNRKIPPEATSIHGITDTMVADARSWPSLYPEIAKLLTNRTCIVYNSDFDRRIIEAANRRYRLPQIPVSWQCAMRHYAAYVGEWNAKYGTYRWHKLERAARAVGSPMPVRHRALADALACRALVIGMAHRRGVSQRPARPARRRVPRPSTRTSREQPAKRSQRGVRSSQRDIILALIIAGLLMLILVCLMVLGIL